MQFAEGSMAPKVEAAVQFATQTGRPAAVGALADASAILAHTAGTWISA
jgi:carbamate kinase